MKNENLWDYIRLAVYTIICLIVVYFVLSFIVQRTVVNGDSMYPALNDGESLMVNKLAYKLGEVERFDVVVFPHYNETKGEEVYYIKRVIGMPGELIQIDNGLIYINGELLSESYGYYDKDLPYYNGIAEEEFYIGEDEYFVLGDNRNNSDDSRTIGCVNKDIIIGEAVYEYKRD